jgi:acetylornithine deacetylase/succinyl-diaminopimelate desuccinylase-like protein
VPDQDPDRILELLRAHIATHTPPGVNVIVRLGHGTQAYSVPADLPALQSVREVLTEVYGMAPYDIRAGGSVPITALFREELGAENIGFGFGLDDELVHSPNEFFRLASFDKGQRAWGLLLERLGA